ncbi:MAG TPA: thiamine phosphate synthase [Terriglobia bacterium]|nr:thiamine phosphate synthase [Terriglobia bacterium]
MTLALPRLYAIIDPAQTGGRPVKAVCEELLAAGVRLIQYRDKQASSRALFETTSGLRDILRGHPAIFIVNDRADIALAVGADGVHVGQEDLPVELARSLLGPDRWVGTSTHNLGQLREADASSAGYVAFGPIFATQSKAKPDPVVGLDGLRQARKATAKPLVAIGGMTVSKARQAIEAGADAVAVISDLVGAPDIAARAREYLRALEQG